MMKTIANLFNGKTCRPLALALALSAGLGLVCVFQFRSSPFFEVPMIDEEGYVEWAERIAAGSAPGEAFYQDPLYPYFLAVMFMVFGKDLLAVRLAQAAMATAAVGLTYLAGRRLGGPRLGLLAAVALALYGGTHFYSLLVLKEAMTLLAAAAVLYLGVLAEGRPEARPRWAVLGLLLGALTLLRGNMLIVVPAVLAWALWTGRGRSFRPGLVRAGLAAAGVAVALAPVTIRNYMAGAEFVLTTSQGGSNFYIGNNERADGRYAVLPFARANPRWQAEDFRVAAERRTGRGMTGAEASRFWFREGLRWLMDHPGDAFRLYLTKAWLVARQYEVPDNHSYYLIRAEFAPALRWAFLGFGALTGPALAGTVLLARGRAGARFPAVFGAAYVASLLPFFIVGRYRLPLAPIWCLGSAYFIIWAAGRVRTRELRALVWPGLAAGALLIAGLWPRPEPDSDKGYSYYLLGAAYLKSGEPGPALGWFTRAREKLPDLDEAREGWWSAVSLLGPEEAELAAAEALRPDLGVEELYGLGRRLEEWGRDEDAAGAYRRVIAGSPGYMPAYARLALLWARRPEGCREAEEYLERAVELRPDYAGREEYREARELIERCWGVE